MLLILSPNKTPEMLEISSAASALGWDILSDTWHIPKYIKGQIGAVYGNEYFCQTIADQMNWSLTSNSFDWSVRLPEKYTSRKIYTTTLPEARNLSTEVFVKPRNKDIFVSNVYKNGCEIKSLTAFDKDMVLVSDPMIFTSKYRCFIKRKTVVSKCCFYYKDYNKEPETNLPYNYNVNHEAVVAFVNNMLADPEVVCEDNIVIDVGRFKKDTYAIIDSRPAYVSPLYGCEKAAALDVIRASCKQLPQ